MPKRTDIKKILVIGSGPIVIGQAAEFEYSVQVEHPDRFELNSATAQIEQSNRRN